MSAQKILYILVGVMFSALLTIATWWISGVNDDLKSVTKVVNQLQWKDQYLNGNVPAAPVEPVAAPPK